MSDLISLDCPSCGGALKVTANATSLICDHCGREHLVRHEAGAVLLESYARCPRCGRNDRVEKVSAILASHTQRVITEREIGQWTGSQSHTFRVPVEQTQVSQLAERLRPPIQPSLPPPPARGESRSGAPIIAGFVITVLSALPLVFDPELRQGAGGKVFQCMGAVGLVLLIGGFLDSEQSSRSAKRLQQEQMVQHQTELLKWQHTMQRWEALYYCYRDDCVFIPGEGTSAPLGELLEYLGSGQ